MERAQQLSRGRGGRNRSDVDRRMGREQTQQLAAGVPTRTRDGGSYAHGNLSLLLGMHSTA